MHLNEFINLDKFQEAVDFGSLILLFFKSKMSYCGTFNTLDLIPLDIIRFHLILQVISFRSYSRETGIRSNRQIGIRSNGIRSKGNHLENKI